MTMVTRFRIEDETGRVLTVDGGGCSVSNCGGVHKAKGFCQIHYNRFRKYGDPLGGRTPNGEPMRLYDQGVLYEGDECLLWPFSVGGSGYGQIWHNGRLQYVHRMACESVHGPQPSPSHQAAHSCGNGHLGCFTKRHLSWKTPKDNQADRVLHGTHGRGENSPCAKLSDAQVLEIRALSGTESQRKIADRYSISFQRVSRIIAGKAWRHVQ